MWSELKIFPSLTPLQISFTGTFFFSQHGISCPELVLKKFQRTFKYLLLLYIGEKSDGETSPWCQYYGDQGPNNCLLANTFKSTVLGPTMMDKGLLLHLSRACFSSLSTWALWLQLLKPGSRISAAPSL